MAASLAFNTTVIDYDEEGRQLLARVHLLEREDSARAQQQHDGPLSPRVMKLKKLNAKSTIIYHDPTTGGAIHVGNTIAASSINHLNAMPPSPCRRIVHCMGTKRFAQRPFRDDPDFLYLDFPIAQWKNLIGYDKCGDSMQVLRFFQPLFDFLDREMRQGKVVLIHCLAGAHRAGTTGIASLMYLTGMSAQEATKTAKSLRPIIDPIGDFPRLLQLLDEGLNQSKPHCKQ